MSLSQIRILVMSLFAVWSLAGAMHAEFGGASLTVAAEEEEDGPEYTPTQETTTVASHPVKERVDEEPGTLLADEAAMEGTVLAYPEQRRNTYTSIADNMLAPMIPHEAAWSQGLGGGTARENIHIGLPVVRGDSIHGLTWNAGPLGFDIYSISAAAFYVKTSGPYATHLPDDGFIAAVSLSGDLLLQLSDDAYLRLQTTVYYLPVQNRVGFYLLSSNASTAEFSYEFNMDRWTVQLRDRFTVFHPVSRLLDEVEVDEIAQAGTYRFGRQDVFYDQSFSTNDIYFQNLGGITAATWLTDEMKLKLLADRWSVWKYNGFEDVGQVNHLGAALFYDAVGSWYLPWARYDWYQQERTGSQDHVVEAGATVPVSRRVQFYALGGWLWSQFGGAGQQIDRQHSIWDIGVVYWSTESLSHSLFGGYAYTINDFGDTFSGRFARYTLCWRPAWSRWSTSFFVQNNKDDETGQEDTVLSGNLAWRMTERDRLELRAAHVRSNNDRLDQRSRGWILRATLTHALTSRLSAAIGCQLSRYEAPSPSSDFDEAMFMASLTETF